MKVAFANRQNCFDRPGGDTVQMMKTKEFLEANYDIEIDVVLDPELILKKKYDLVHIFNIHEIDQAFRFLQNSLKMNGKTVVSTIFWDLSAFLHIYEYSRLGFHNPNKLMKGLQPLYNLKSEILASFINEPKFFSEKFRKFYKYICESANMILPASEEELGLVQKFVANENLKNSIILQAVDQSIFYPSETYEKNSVLCIGRIECTKNQTNLIASLLKNPEINIKIVGKDVQMTNGYGKRVAKLAKLQKNTFIMNQRLTDIELGRTMANAHVHYLASFCEPSALTSIEALACGLNIVVSDENYCPTRTYYGGLLNKRVFTCDPFDVSSIRAAILNALKTPSDRSAIKDFSWKKTAAQTYNAYRQVLEQV